MANIRKEIGDFGNNISIAFGVVIRLLLLIPVFYSILLLGFQILSWMSEGVWVSLPAIYLFVDPIFLLETTLEKAPYIEIMESPIGFVPDWFQSNNSWLAWPNSWLGLHKVIAGVLNIISIPVFLGGIFGAFYWTFSQSCKEHEIKNW